MRRFDFPGRALMSARRGRDVRGDELGQLVLESLQCGGVRWS